LPKYDHTKEHKLIFHVLPKLSFLLLRVNNNCVISWSSLPWSDNESILESICSITTIYHGMNLWLVHLDGIIVLRNTKMPASIG
ncbi:hypothetical protein T05_3033, partial [Trichinella murrelli]